MKHFSLLFAAAIGSCFAPVFATPVSLSGTVLALDSTAKSGVVVSLSGTSLTATTGDDGNWSLSGATSVIAARSGSASKTLTRHVVLDGERLRLSIGGRDIAGRPLSGASASKGASAARTVASTLDTLIYSWNGTVILRDTIGEDSLSQSGILRFFDTTVNAAITHGYVTDAQGHLYRTVKIGAQTWMAQNLNVKVDSSWCYEEVKDSCDKYGRLYKWASAMGLDTSYNYKLWSGTLPHQGLCPSGWHVPSNAEWTRLTDTTLDSATAGTALKSALGWSSGNGTDSLGFRILPAGYRHYNLGSFYYAGLGVGFWSASSEYTRLANYHCLYTSMSDVGVVDDFKSFGLSVRCLKD